MHNSYHAPHAQHALHAQYTDADLDNGYYSAVNLGSSFGVQREHESREKLLQEDDIRGEINIPVTIQNEGHWQEQEQGSTKDLYVYTIGHAGLTQSDSSITSSRNPPYSYGNQCEYLGLSDLWISDQTVDDPEPIFRDPGQQLDNDDTSVDFGDNEDHKDDPDSVSPQSDTYQQEPESGSDGIQSGRPLIPSLKCRKTSDSSESRGQRKSVTFSTDGDDVCQIDDADLVDDVYDVDDDEDGDDENVEADWLDENRDDDGSKSEKESLLGSECEESKQQSTYI